MVDTASDSTHRSITVRDMDINDLAPVFHLGDTLFTSELYPFIYRTWDEWEVIGLYNTDPEYCLVAEAGDRLAGFVLGTIINKAPSVYGYILWLGVNPEFQRRKVADKLVDKLIERMIDDGAQFMMADTDPQNIPAVKFFSRKGFGTSREHVFLSMDLSQHEYYGKLIAYEQEKKLRNDWKRPRRPTKS